jgi:hypothetical protein
MAVTLQDSSIHSYSAGIWSRSKPLSVLNPGKYDVTVNGTPGSCDPGSLLGGHSKSIPYFSGVKCVFEGGTGAKLMPRDGSYFLVNLPVPDRIHPAAAIEFGVGDYQGADAQSSLVAPKRTATVMIFEYRHADSITINYQNDGSSTKVGRGEHYHFSQTLLDSSMSVCDEIEHIKMFSSRLSALLIHPNGGNPTPVDFTLNPVDMAIKPLHISTGVYNVHRAELGLGPLFSQKPQPVSCDSKVVFTFGKPGRHKMKPFYARLVNCAAGHVAASG